MTSDISKDGIHELAKQVFKNQRQDLLKKECGDQVPSKLDLFANYLFRDSSPELMAQAAMMVTHPSQHPASFL
ncbi:hypothetical protein HDU98_004796, partial [Podochytrium sp. JEL0797]